MIGSNRLLIIFLTAHAMISFYLSPAHAMAGTRVTGTVVDLEGRPIEKALVRLQGAPSSTITDKNGRFIIHANDPVTSKYVTAWKNGFYNGGQTVSAKEVECRIELTPMPQGDIALYKWLPSVNQPQTQLKITEAATEAEPCQKCHEEITGQWAKSTHATSMTNPLFQAFFQGADNRGKKGVGPGYKMDFPNSNGNCATCHVPAQGLKRPFNSNPYEASGVEREGVFCDICHKIDSVRLDESGGYPGTMSIQFKRPAEGRQVFFGPYDDVFPGNDSYHPLYKESRYCAPCHHGKFWGALMYSEFQEWADSEYATKNITCQDCHMKSDGVSIRFAAEKAGAVERDPQTVPTHFFYGIRDRTFMEESIALDIVAGKKDGCLNVTVMVRNINAGHSYPTGNPMRNMILLVDVVDENGRGLIMEKGENVPEWGGVGPVKEGNYAGLPGKGFAKVLRDSTPYANNQPRHFYPEYPAPHWRPTTIESDNRIPANGSDISKYQYRIPADLRGPIRVASRLFFRMSYKKWLDGKGFKLDEMEIARKSLIIGGAQ